MLTIKAIITDDEFGARQVLKTLLSEFFPEIEIVAICEDLPSCIRAVKKYKPDVLFLDIEMPEYSGLDIYTFLDEGEVTFELIFTTAYNEYATDAFRLAAIDYLLKPIQFHQLQEAVERLKAEVKKQTALEQLSVLKSNMAGQTEKRICISTSEGKYYVPFNELIALEADGSYTSIYTQNQGKIYASRRLKFFEDMLEGDERFIRIHRSNLINKMFVEKLIKGDENYVLLKNGQQLSVATEKLRQVQEMLIA